MYNYRLKKFIAITCMSLCFSACGTQDNTPGTSMPTDNPVSKERSAETAPVKGTRDNVSQCLVPQCPGSNILGNDIVTIDISNSSEGYICVDYSGDAARTRIILTTPLNIAYTYDIHKGICDTFPLTGSSGTYNIGVYELIDGNDYSVLFNEDFNVTSVDEYLPYLYPNQYVCFDKNSNAVSLAQELAFSANNDLDVIQNIYNHIISSISYDYDKAENVESTYIPNIDDVLESGKGICFDYASLMAAMLRSQGIPTRLEIGYAGDAYHAWISTYVHDIGWINGIIEFNGKDWEIMDPTFAANMSEKSLKSFIGEGDNYITQYMY